MLGKKLQATSQDKRWRRCSAFSVSTMIMIISSIRRACGLAGILVGADPVRSIQMARRSRSKPSPPPSSRGSATLPVRSSATGAGIIETFGAAYISVPYKDGLLSSVVVLFSGVPASGHLGERRADKKSAPARICRSRIRDTRGSRC